MFNKTYSYDLQRAIERHGFRPQYLWKNSKYQVDKTYWCGYWSKYYRVLAVEYDGDFHVTVTIEWQDGKVATHHTSLDWQSDWELRWPEGKQFEIEVASPVEFEIDEIRCDDFAEFDMEGWEIA